MALPRKWLPLFVGGALNGAVKAATDEASGSYAIRTKRGHGVVYVGESHVGRMWRTLLRHFQTDNFRGDLPRFKRAEDYEVAWKVTSQGKREKSNGDQRAMALQAEWIEGFRAKGHKMHNVDDGLADDTSFDFGANAEPAGAFDDLRLSRDNPRALVSAVKLRELASGELDGREHSALYLKLLAAVDRATDKEARATGDHAAANARNAEGRAEVRAANAAGDVARAARYERELSALRDKSRAATPAADSYEHELAVMRGKRGNPAPAAQRGALVELGVLTGLKVGPRELRWSLRGAPVLAYDADKRLHLVYAVGRVERASSPAEVKEYARKHWGNEGRGDVRGGGLAPPAFVDVGPATSITYTTKKGVDRKLVDYVHPFGEGSSRRCVFPRVLEHRCAGGCSPRCAARGSLRLDGGSYTVEDRGIVG